MFRRALTLLACVAPATAGAQRLHATVTISPHDSISAFDPVRSLGSTIDGHIQGATGRIFTPANVAAMKSANFHPISYRLRTELGIEAWHWNPRGSWSDAAHDEGYWTSSDALAAPIRVSYGYNLPRRGNTIDQAGDDGYSRLTDGDTTSFWKSNPYLDSIYTGESAARHPQWVVIDLERNRNVNAIRIMWGTPFASSYDVQYWSGEQPRGPDDNADDAGWKTFPDGAVRNGLAGSGGDVTIWLARQTVSTRWIRILLHTSSRTAPNASKDVRDSLGFAIRELYIGRDNGATFVDITRRGRSLNTQTRTYASSTDPWHRASDRDVGTEQPGIDLLFGSGMTRGLPMLLPVGVYYDTPANAASLLRYVRKRHYAVPRVELGEEPDGQFIAPADFAALYAQAADSLRSVDPRVVLGGPSLQDAQTKVMMAWKEGTTDERSWLSDFVRALSETGHARDLAFVSFEFYPFDDICNGTARQLAQVPNKISSAIAQMRSDGVPPTVPLFMTEYGYSAFSAEAEMDRAGAIFVAQTVAQFLSLGGTETYFYGTEPSSMDRGINCPTWGDNTLFLADDDRHIIAKNSTYHTARMITTAWADSDGGSHTMLATRVTTLSKKAPPIGAFSVRRPDGRIAVLLLNRDSLNTWTVDVRGLASAHDTLDAWRLSATEYEWHAAGAKGRARPNSGPRKMLLATGAPVTLPPYSVTVVRER